MSLAKTAALLLAFWALIGVVEQSRTVQPHPTQHQR
jgi:hypothetical protein